MPQASESFYHSLMPNLVEVIDVYQDGYVQDRVVYEVRTEVVVAGAYV